MKVRIVCSHHRMAKIRSRETWLALDGGEAGKATTVALFPRGSLPLGTGGADLEGGLGEVSRKGTGVVEGVMPNGDSGASI